uniref:Uncharacterized protein n=1 Tax=Setaria italica TaxID=4555 RepID=K3Y4L2_SETIT
MVIASSCLAPRSVTAGQAALAAKRRRSKRVAQPRRAKGVSGPARP